MYRAHRFAYEQLTGIQLTPPTTLMHRCDVPLCVRAGETDEAHVVAGSTRLNNIDRSAKLRHANAYSWRWRGKRKKLFADKSRQLRDALVEHGWDENIIRPLLLGQAPDTPRLF